MKNNGEMDRRNFLRYAGALGVTSTIGTLWPVAAKAATVTLPFDNGVRPLVQYPEKRLLIQLTTRPPQLETPFSVFDGNVFTPNDAFYVRYHNSFIFGGPPTGPQTIDSNTFRINVGGNVNTPLSISIADLKTKYTQMEIAAVNQCSGNSRGFFSPRVRGGQWANGAMGNARWRGVSLKEVLTKAGVGAGAVQVAFNALDQTEGEAPDFEKALDLSVAMNGEVMLAYMMNGEELPALNGFPVRLVVPGYYSTYWVKHINQITVVNSVYDTYYMTKAYRIPNNACACVPPGTTPTSTIPIGKMNVRSFITNVSNGQKMGYGSMGSMGTSVRGIAFDGGSGIKNVAFSSDGGGSWQNAQLGMDYGKYSFRQWQIQFSPPSPGTYVLKVRATNNAGQTQPLTPTWNPSGYMRNVVESVTVTVA